MKVTFKKNQDYKVYKINDKPLALFPKGNHF